METESVYCETGADFIWRFPLLPSVPPPVMELSPTYSPYQVQTPSADVINLLWVQAPESLADYFLPFFSQPRQNKCSCKQKSNLVTGFPYHRPSDGVSVHIWLKGPRDFDLGFVQFSAISSLFGLLL